MGGQVALAAGHFRSSVSNAELVLFGQIDHQSAGYSVLSIQIVPGQNGTFTASLANIAPYKFKDKHHSTGAFAQAASVLNWPQTTNQQIVLGTQVSDLGEQSYIDIGSFDTQFNFTLQSETRLTTANQVVLQSMKVGNSTTRVRPMSRNVGSRERTIPALQIETFTVETNFIFPTGVIRIWGIDPPNPIVNVTDWLKDLNHVTVSASPLNTYLYGVVPGDIQGAALRLGTPR